MTKTMEPLKDASHLYEVERRAFHAERPGFRINELQISPTQKVPWHFHSNIQDTFYVIEGHSGFSCGNPMKRRGSARVRVTLSERAGRTWSPTVGMARLPSSCFRVLVSTITFPSCSRARR